MEEDDPIRATLRNNRVIITSLGKKQVEILYPIFFAARQRQPTLSLTELSEQLLSLAKWEEQGNRVLGWQCQERLCAVDGADTVIGLDPVVLSPHIAQGWAELDPEQWTEKQTQHVSQATALVVVLTGAIDTQIRLLSYLRTLTARNLKLIVVTSSVSGTPATNRLNKLMEFSRQLCRLTVKCPVWQTKGQWQRRPGLTASGGRTASVWAAGTRDMQ